MTAFTYRSARSPGIIGGIAVAILAETVALHALLVARHPWLAWLMTLSSATVLWWLIDHYRAMGKGCVSVTATEVDARIGKRISIVIPRSSISAVTRPTFRDLPAPGSADAEYANLTKPSRPNVLLTLHEPASVRISRFRRRARRIALHLDDPDAFIMAIRA